MLRTSPPSGPTVDHWACETVLVHPLGIGLVEGRPCRHDKDFRFLPTRGSGTHLDTASVDSLFLGQVRLGINRTFGGQILPPLRWILLANDHSFGIRLAL